MSKEKAIRELVEENGKVFEKFGFTPMQGRIVAYFMHSDNPEKTFDEVVAFFESSKSSVSNSLNYLLQSRIIDYRTISARRKRYFYLTDAFVRIYIEKVLDNVRELREYALSAVSMRSPEYPEVSERILKWIGNANYFQDNLENTLARISNENL
jgi:DNA-binding transcriptional regulator GbsR (MarR family)